MAHADDRQTEESPSDDDSELEAHLQTRRMMINLGPSHPAMHGTVRMRVELEGETIVRADPEIGFLHRGFQKSCENVTWNQCLPYTDRLNYVSAIMNNLGFLKAVEKLIGLEIPERAQYIRVLSSELHRMHDHLTCVGAIGLELGGFSAFLYAIEARELIMDRVSELTGARLTTTFGRVGGLNRDLPDGWIERVTKTLDKIHELLGEVDGLLTANRIFVDRMRGTGVITAQDALDFGFTGPCLRANGINYDVRKAQPYWVYDRMSFDVPIGQNGDNYDRYLMRMEELKQSEAIVRQSRKILKMVESLLDRGKGEQARVALDVQLLDVGRVARIGAGSSGPQLDRARQSARGHAAEANAYPQLSADSPRRGGARCLVLSIRGGLPPRSCFGHQKRRFGTRWRCTTNGCDC